MSLREQLQTIHATHGALTPDLVVEEATPKSSPLHDRFEWNNSVAGHAYRLIQARELIRSVKVTYRNDLTGEKSTVRAFQSVRRADAASPSYEPTEKVLEDEFATAMILRDMERDIVTLKNRYEHFVEFAEMVKKHLGVEAA